MCYKIFYFCLITLSWITLGISEKLPHEEEEPEIPSSISVSLPNENETTSSPVANMGFVQAFVGAFSVIVVSELGDKTFFIAAIMAMTHSRLLVFLGAILALAFMTILSVVFGWAATIIPKIYTYYVSIVLFLIFGLKMLWDGFKMSPSDGQEELQEVQADLRRREEELAAKQSERRIASPTAAQPQTNQVMPVVEPVNEISGANGGAVIMGSKTEQNNIDGKDSLSPQFEKETLTKDPETGGTRMKHSSKRKMMKLLSHILVQAFTLTFLAEWGDRSQITTILLAAKDNIYGVAIGGILGHGLCTGIAVLGGRFVAQKISVKTVTIAGGIVFIIFALMTFFLDSAEEPSQIHH